MREEGRKQEKREEKIKEKKKGLFILETYLVPATACL